MRITNCREVRQKDDIKFNHENKTVSYFQRRLWYFDAKLSNGSLSDIITNLDIVVVVSCVFCRVLSTIEFSVPIVTSRGKEKKKNKHIPKA